MASPSSDRFQSRLFNALDWRWPARVAEQVRRGARWLSWHAQAATVLTAQVLLYPVYLVYQGGRGLVQQLAAPRTLPALPVADTPRQRVQAQAGLDLPQSVAPVKSKDAAVCSLAADLQTRQLVLVSAQGERLEPLTPQQQADFRQLIALEVADYHRRHKAVVRALRSPVAEPTLPSSPLLQVPVSLLTQVMAWMQRGPVARAVDLFGEQQGQPEAPAPMPPDAATPTAGRLIRVLSAWLERPIQTLQTLASRVSSAPVPPSAPDAPTLVQPAQAAERQAQAHDLRGLIQAALHYFLARAARRRTLEPSAPESLPATAPAKTLNPAAQPDPWLTLADLFVEPEAIQAAVPVPEIPALVGTTTLSNATLPALAASRAAALAQVSGHSEAAAVRSTLPALAARQRRRAVGRPEIAPEIAPGVAPEAVSGPTQRRRQPPVVAASPRSKLTRNRPIRTPAQPDLRPEPGRPDWIEAQATLIGYVKSPFTRLFEWLDRLVARFEARVLALCNWLRRQFWP